MFAILIEHSNFVRLHINIQSDCFRTHIESGYPDYTPGIVPTAEIYSKLYEYSPIAHLHKVVTPTMIMLGQEDRRVPPCLGIEYHKALISKGVKSK